MPIFDTAAAKVADFCALVGLSRQRVTTLRQTGTITGTTLGEWLSSYIESLRAKAAGRGDPALAREKQALMTAKRKLAELQLGEKEGRLVDGKQAKASAAVAGMTIRDAMLAVPARTAATLAGMGDERDVERYLSAELRSELTRVADMADPTREQLIDFRDRLNAHIDGLAANGNADA